MEGGSGFEPYFNLPQLPFLPQSCANTQSGDNKETSKSMEDFHFFKYVSVYPCLFWTKSKLIIIMPTPKVEITS